MLKKYAVCIDFVKPNRRAAKKMTTKSHSNFGMANLLDLLPKVATSRNLEYGLNIAAKENYCTRPMAISMLTTRTNPSHLALHPKKSKLTMHAVSIQT